MHQSVVSSARALQAQALRNFQFRVFLDDTDRAAKLFSYKYLPASKLKRFGYWLMRKERPVNPKWEAQQKEQEGKVVRFRRPSPMKPAPMSREDACIHRSHY